MVIGYIANNFYRVFVGTNGTISTQSKKQAAE